MNQYHAQTRLTPPQSWKNPATHFLDAMNHPWYATLLALQDGFQVSTVDFWKAEDIRCALLPITTGSISSPMGLGSDSTPVQVEIAGVKTYLADSMQFSLELGCRFWNKGCYYVMPSFRGEAADDTHLCQFFHSEAEIPGKLDDVMTLVERYVQHLGQFYLEHFKTEVLQLAGTLDHLYELCERPRPFKRMTFDQADVALRHVPGGVTYDPGGWRSLTRKGERALIETYGDFLWVTHWDDIAVPFYQAVEIDADGKRRALNADLLFGIGETAGAGERHETVSEVEDALTHHGVPADSYRWYLDMRTARPMKTSGFGMGVERFFMWLLKHDDIRDLQLLPRFNGEDIVP